MILRTEDFKILNLIVTWNEMVKKRCGICFNEAQSLEGETNIDQIVMQIVVKL